MLSFIWSVLFSSQFRHPLFSSVETWFAFSSEFSASWLISEAVTLTWQDDLGWSKRKKLTFFLSPFHTGGVKVRSFQPNSLFFPLILKINHTFANVNQVILNFHFHSIFLKLYTVVWIWWNLPWILQSCSCSRKNT